MNEIVPILKNEEEEQPVPTLWRQTLWDIVEAFKHGDFQLSKGVIGVDPLSEVDAKRIAYNIADYGEELVTLPAETWDTSIYRWMDGYWQVLVDLFTLEEGASDLVLFLKVREDNDEFRFIVESLHVP